MLRVGLQTTRLQSPFKLALRTQVSRAAKKLNQTDNSRNDEPGRPLNTPQIPGNNNTTSAFNASNAPPSSPVPPSSANPTHTEVNPAAQQHAKQQQRAFNLIPKFMRNYTSRIAQAPLSHVTSFLIVHELSAIVPLFGVWAGLYYLDYVPLGIPDFVVQNGAQFIRNFAERQGWTFIANAETGSKLILQGAVAWGIVKALLPVRIAFSLWAMPGFARWIVVPVTSRVSSLFRKLFTKK